MSRPSQIRFLSRTAHLYDSVVRLLGFPRLWEAVAACAGTPAARSCLDVCTGTGGVALALARRGARVTAVDVAPGMLARARSKGRAAGLAGRIDLSRMDARRLAFADRAFPVVVCAMALHEMAEAERATVLAELGRVAAERVVVAEYRVPERGIRRAAFLVRHAYEYLESDDFGAFVMRPLAERLEKSGLRVESSLDTGAYRIWSCRVGA